MRIITLACLFLLLPISASFAADPLKAHEAGFGPEILGLQLGKRMTWPEMVSTQRNIQTTPRPSNMPGIPLPVFDRFGMTIADNYKALVNDSPEKKPGKWIVVNFHGDSATVMNGGGGMLQKIPEKGSLGDLFAMLKKNGLNHAETPNIKLRDGRVIEYSLDKALVAAQDSTTSDFAQRLSNIYALGTMEKKDESYEISNPPEGWRVVVTAGAVHVFSLPIPEKPKK